MPEPEPSTTVHPSRPFSKPGFSIVAANALLEKNIEEVQRTASVLSEFLNMIQPCIELLNLVGLC
jgi:hypothetical protein